MPERPIVADFARLLAALRAANVDFIIIGGMAMISHGSAHITFDLDVLYHRTPENFGRIVRALQPLRPALRGAPEDLPFLFDERTLKSGLNFTFMTDAGPIDLLGEVSGVGRYEDAVGSASNVPIYGGPSRVLSIDDLIRAKEAAGRNKDLAALDELRELKRLLEADAPPPPDAPQPG